MLNIKSRLVRLAGPIGGFRLCRGLSRATPKILMYHRFSECAQAGFVHREVFEKQITYLKNNFNVVSLGALVTEYRKGKTFPANTIVITIDDGYQDFYEIAFPVLQKHNVSATFFVTTRFIDGDFWLWPDSVRYMLEHSDAIDLSTMPGGLEYKSAKLTKNDKQLLWDMIVMYLLTISENDKKVWLIAFAKLQKVKLPDEPAESYRAVSWSQVRKLDDNGIEIGVHTQSHPSLGKLEVNQIKPEVIGSVKIIEKQIGHRPKSFCFPNGQPDDYTEVVKKSVEKAGCQSAVTAFYDEYLVDDLFELRRFNVSTDWQYFLRAVNGVDALAAKYLKTNNIMNGSI